jgi:ABC-type glutathione transport system ATPase component
MLAIGRALMSKPKLLLLDEPSMGLAPLMVQKVFETVLKVSQEGVTILLIEQNAKLALEVSNRGYVMESGEITLAGDAKTLLHDRRCAQPIWARRLKPSDADSADPATPMTRATAAIFRRRRTCIRASCGGTRWRVRGRDASVQARPATWPRSPCPIAAEFVLQTVPAPAAADRRRRSSPAADLPPRAADGAAAPSAR